jgi:hypothetical protein
VYKRLDKFERGFFYLLKNSEKKRARLWWISYVNLLYLLLAWFFQWNIIVINLWGVLNNHVS